MTGDGVSPARPNGLDPRQDTQAGFSLIEMLVVIAILALAAAVVAPSLAGIVPGRRLAAAADAVAGELGRLRGDALRTGLSTRLVFAPEAGRFLSSRREAPALLMRGLDVRVEAAPTSRAGPGEILFTPDGSSTGGRIVIASAAGTRLLTVSRITGAVRRAEAAP